MKTRSIMAAGLIAATSLCCMIAHSCGNTSTAPTGGPKDTIPPVLLSVNPAHGATNFPLTGGTVSLRFDEYTVVKDQQQILLSPPGKKKPKAKPKGKDIVVSFQDTLLPNTTYTLDFGKSLADNNEGNLNPRYVYVFSTGEEIDSMYFCGTVVDCETLAPVKNALVSLYTDLSDSASINLLPVAATRSDDWGFFALRNVKPQPYRIYATTDENFDYKYNPGEERIGFCDTMITPHLVVRDSVYELLAFDMKDTLECLARKGEIEIAVFKEFYANQFIKNKGRKKEKTGYVTFSAPDVDIRSFQIMGVDSTDIIMQYSPQHDSIDFWINADYPLSDSLLITINYMKTDSTGTLSLTQEDIAVAMSKEERAKAKTDKGIEAAKADTLTNLKLNLDEKTVEQVGISFEFDTPIIEMCMDSIILVRTNTRNQTDTTSYTFVQDTTNIMRYILQASEGYKPGFKYNLIVGSKAFHDVYHRFNSRSNKEFQLPKTEDKSSITLNVKGTQGQRYIVELVDENCKKVFRTYVVTEDGPYYYPYIEKGRYSIRITEDRNGNGLFDTGNLMKWQQAEPIKLFKLPDDTKVIILEEPMDLVQDIDLQQIFK
ncbi:MAG: Ig-like domain-containing protein [Bacteroidales bacterium]|nr:Ig-like domain-containing protein [Bacteroidales bacterium]